MTEVTGPGYRLILGDCLDVMPGLKAGTIVTDPPYGLNFAYNSFDDTRENVARLIGEFMPIARRVSERVFVLPGITQMALYPEPDWVSCVTWNTTGSFGKFGYSQWMPVLCYGPDVAGFGNVAGEILKGDVLQINGGGGVGFRRSDGESNHPCPKPLTVMRQLVRRFSLPGDTILDPFAGSGTTGVACVLEGRRFIGVELDPAYHAIAARRLADAAAQPMLIPSVESEPMPVQAELHMEMI